MKRPIIIAVAGGTASGKTTIVREIVNSFSKVDVTVISHDDYYKDQSHLSLEDRKKTNYDHPDSFDNELFHKHITKLMNWEPIDKPMYDYVEHNRKKETEVVNPTKVIIIEGILVLHDKKIRELTDVNIFVQCDEDISFTRRLKRDINERGRTVDNVIEQYLTSVKPMYKKYVLPSSQYADIIIPNETGHKVAMEFLLARIKQILSEE